MGHHCQGYGHFAAHCMLKKTENESSVEKVLTIMKLRTVMQTTVMVPLKIKNTCPTFAAELKRLAENTDYLVMFVILRIGITSSRPSPARNGQ